jgi:hypothetical protein
MALAALISFVVTLNAGSRVVGCNAQAISRVLAGPVAASGCMAVVVRVTRAFLPPAPTWGTLALQVLLGVAVYVGVAALLDRLLDAGVVSALRSAISAVRTPRPGNAGVTIKTDSPIL